VEKAKDFQRPGSFTETVLNIIRMPSGLGLMTPFFIHKFLKLSHFLGHRASHYTESYCTFSDAERASYIFFLKFESPYFAFLSVKYFGISAAVTVIANSIGDCTTSLTFR